MLGTYQRVYIIADGTLAFLIRVAFTDCPSIPYATSPHSFTTDDNMLNEVDAELLGLYMLLITYGEFAVITMGNRWTEKLTCKRRCLPRGLLPEYSHVPTEEHPRQPSQSVAPRRNLAHLRYRNLRQYYYGRAVDSL